MHSWFQIFHPILGGGQNCWRNINGKQRFIAVVFLNNTHICCIQRHTFRCIYSQTQRNIVRHTFPNTHTLAPALLHKHSQHTCTRTRRSAVMPFCRILLWVQRPRWVRWLAAPEELVGRDSWAKLLKYGQEFPLSLPLRQLAPLCAIMEIKCTEAWNEGGKEGGRGGEGEVGERRRKNVRFMELGKLKVIKSEDYSTAKLLKFLREVEGFRLVLNSKALGVQQYTLFTIYFYPFSSILFTLFFSLVFLLPPFIQLTVNIELLLNFYSEEHLRLPFLPSLPPVAAVCRQRRKKEEKEQVSKRYSKKRRGRQRRSDWEDRLVMPCCSIDTTHSVKQCIHLSRTFITVNFLAWRSRSLRGRWL